MTKKILMGFAGMGCLALIIAGCGSVAGAGYLVIALLFRYGS